MTHALRLRRFRLRGVEHVQHALRRFRLPEACTLQDVRLAFLREYGPLQSLAVSGRKGVTMECERLIRQYDLLRAWMQKRLGPPYFVAAVGCGHPWFWTWRRR